jgi:hypothetical protein
LKETEARQPRVGVGCLGVGTLTWALLIMVTARAGQGEMGIPLFSLGEPFICPLAYGGTATTGEARRCACTFWPRRMVPASPVIAPHHFAGRTAPLTWNPTTPEGCRTAARTTPGGWEPFVPTATGRFTTERKGKRRTHGSSKTWPCQRDESSNPRSHP